MIVSAGSLRELSRSSAITRWYLPRPSTGKQIARTGTSTVIFGYNGRDGVVTEDNGLIYMRARYYSPEMKRFVNTDIIHGKISDSTSLNRYAYVNGNPVSYVDPFGLWGIKNLWSKVKTFVKEKIVKPVVAYVKSAIQTFVQEEIIEPFQSAVKAVENDFLHLDARFTGNDNFDNYESNLMNDKTNDYVYGQDKLVGMKLGNSDMSDVGCEVVAVYNAKIALGFENVSLAQTIETFEGNYALISQTLADGELGSNPYKLPRVFEDEGLKYKTIGDFDDISAPGVYIVSFWNSSAVGSKIHTVMIQVDKTNKANVYNLHEKDETSLDWRLEPIEPRMFITGYQVSRK